MTGTGVRSAVLPPVGPAAALSPAPGQIRRSSSPAFCPRPKQSRSTTGLGQDEFPAHYGFGRATAYLLIVDGKAFDSKAFLGVAYRLATSKPMGAHDLNAEWMGPLACCAAWALRSGTSVTGSGRARPG